MRNAMRWMVLAATWTPALGDGDAAGDKQGMEGSQGTAGTDARQDTPARIRRATARRWVADGVS
jgi:hypothetical protein